MLTVEVGDAQQCWTTPQSARGDDSDLQLRLYGWCHTHPASPARSITRARFRPDVSGYLVAVEISDVQRCRRRIRCCLLLRGVIDSAAAVEEPRWHVVLETCAEMLGTAELGQALLWCESRSSRSVWGRLVP